MVDIKDVLNSFKDWYEGDGGDERRSKEDFYKDTINEEYLSSLGKDDFIKFFIDFVKEGGGIQSTINMNIETLKTTINNQYEAFRDYMLEPFSTNFDDSEWLKRTNEFTQFGDGAATIYLCRVNKSNYPVMNGRTKKALNTLGVKLSGNEVKKYKLIKDYQSKLINENKFIHDFYEADAFMYFTDEEFPKIMKLHAEVIYKYLKESFSHRDIEDKVLKITPLGSGLGYKAMEILHKYDIKGNKKGVLKNTSLEDEYNSASDKYRKALVLLKEHYPELHDGSYFPPHEVSENNNPESKPEEYSPNIILYGPPGTGKTYNTIDRSVKIANFNAYTKGDHKANKEVYDELVKAGRIVFTTFHQSLGYEDFIEGIKANTVKVEVHYSVEPGIFKRLVDKINKEEPIEENFDITYQKLRDEVFNNDSLVLKIRNKPIEFKIEEPGDNITFNEDSGKKVEVRRESLKMYLETGDCQEFSPYLKGVSIYMVEKLGYKIVKQNFVLIIDEINRGNVSNIFGELITLIEIDKRIGGDNELQITLPYTPNETFGVPKNLYILGTMNTADRSVEALDTALRRRFVFEEILPDPTKIIDENDNPKTVTIEGGVSINLQDLLIKINERIEVLIDSDHLIGHSYFMGVKDLDGLRSVFENNIIPLLQEYFYGEYGKIGLVLGNGFVYKEDKKIDLFAEFKYDGKEDLNQSVYKLVDFKDNSFNFSEAIQSLSAKAESDNG